MAQSSKATPRKGGLLGEFTDLLASVKHMFDGYHPERHYMRGPGPAWHQARCGSEKRVACRAGLFLNLTIGWIRQGENEPAAQSMS